MNNYITVPEGLRNKAPFWSQVLENNDLDDIFDDQFEPPIGCNRNLDIQDWSCCVAGEVYNFKPTYKQGCKDCAYYSGEIGDVDDPSDMEVLLSEFNDHLEECKFYNAPERQ